ncbi:MAG: hypothetical protein AXA67_02565 [Methylothermaceae bacteria B42]|nr:MAG: hypothetical protein AXA67_02565 [Methylothermaceae bacteria B42]HHJ38092.1 chloride channel protein [Methylothermaceae bacterium]
MTTPTETPASSLFSASVWKQRLVFWSGAILVGLFISALTLVSEKAVAEFRQLHHYNPWLVFLICPFGLATVVWMTEGLFSGAERSGVPQVKAALSIHHNLALRSRFVSFRIAVGKVILTNLGLLSGASAGLGGPAIQIGASIMTSLGKAARFPTHYLERGFILAGSAAGFAALFSAPLTGIIFAIEELGHSMEEKIGSLVLTAIIFSGMTAFVVLDHYVFLESSQAVLPKGRSWLAVPLCGVAGGLMGGLFSTILLFSARRLAAISFHQRLLLAMACGLGLAAIGTYASGATFGTGYPMLKRILTDPDSMPLDFPFLKMLATYWTALCGIPAGLFVPSLSVGAGLGADLHTWLPLAPALTMILLTMTAYFSGMLQSPMTSFVLVMEMTDTHELLLPLMAASFIASGTSRLFNPQSLYTALTESYARKLEQDE